VADRLREQDIRIAELVTFVTPSATTRRNLRDPANKG
jgi:hypothetical protein